MTRMWLCECGCGCGCEWTADVAFNVNVNTFDLNFSRSFFEHTRTRTQHTNTEFAKHILQLSCFREVRSTLLCLLVIILMFKVWKFFGWWKPARSSHCFNINWNIRPTKVLQNITMRVEIYHGLLFSRATDLLLFAYNLIWWHLQ